MNNYEFEKVALSNGFNFSYNSINILLVKFHFFIIDSCFIIFFSCDSRWYWYHIITYINFIVQCQIWTFIVHKNIIFPYIEKIILHVSLYVLQQFSFSLNRKGVHWVIFKGAINIFLVVNRVFHSPKPFLDIL